MKYLLLTLVLSVITFGKSQELNCQAKNAQYVGVHFGPTTGMGVSYRLFKNKTGFQATALGYKHATYIDFNTGLSLIHKLVSKKNVDFISYLGSRFTYKEEKVLSLTSDNEDIIIKTLQEWRINTSLGLGLQLRIFNHLEFSFQVGYALFNANGQRTLIKNNKFQRFIDHPGNPWTMVTGEIGLYYKINRQK
tara:strand:+ start:125 stop:700 length:576 start_codon:yes stop_codon:yes gene_type:complete